MKLVSLSVALVLFCTQGCSSVASSSPEVGAGSQTPASTQFTETSWPLTLTNQTGWEQTGFVFGLLPRIMSTGGIGATVDIRSREGDTLVGLSYFAAGNGYVSVQARVFALSVRGSVLLSDVFDQPSGVGFSLLPLPLKEPHVMAQGEGLVLQLDASGQGYQVTAIQATWSRAQ